MRLAKTKALISFAVTAKLICDFVFAFMQIVGFLMRRLIEFKASSHISKTLLEIDLRFIAKKKRLFV